VKEKISLYAPPLMGGVGEGELLKFYKIFKKRLTIASM